MGQEIEDHGSTLERIARGLHAETPNITVEDGRWLLARLAERTQPLSKAPKQSWGPGRQSPWAPTPSTPDDQRELLIKALNCTRWINTKCGACGTSYRRCGACAHGVRVTIAASGGQCGGHEDVPCAESCQLEQAVRSLAGRPSSPADKEPI